MRIKLDMSQALLLHLECHGNGNEKLAELGIESEVTEWRECVLPVDAINMIYAHSDGGTLIIVGGDDLRFRESYEEIKAMLNE